MDQDRRETADSAPGSPAQVRGDPASMSASDLFAEIARQVSSLAKTELELAKSELRANVLDEVKMAAGFSVAGVLGLIAVTLLLVTVVLALATVVPGWVAGAIVSGVVLLAAGGAVAFGWSKRVRRPLGRTRREIEEDARWAKNRVT